MCKKRFLIYGLLAVVLMSAPALRAEEIRNPWSIKIFGGGLFGANGDIRAYWLAYDEYFSRWAEAYGYTKSGSLDWPGAGMTFGGEIARSFSSRLSAGLAVGQFSKRRVGSFSLSSGETDKLDMTFSATSVVVFGGYDLPLMKAVSLYFKAGLGTLFGSLDTTLDVRMADLGGVLVTARYKATGFVGQGGAGLEWKLAPRLALHLEGGYMFAPLSDWTGDDLHDWGTGSLRHNGTLYYVEMQHDTERIPTLYYPGLILGNPMEGTRVVGYREFKSDLSGLYFLAGLLFRL